MASRVQFFRDAAPGSDPIQPSGHELNLECSECGAPANWGEGVSLIHGCEGTWFCARHVPERLRYPELALANDPAQRDPHEPAPGGSSQRA